MSEYLNYRTTIRFTSGFLAGTVITQTHRTHFVYGIPFKAGDVITPAPYSGSGYVVESVEIIGDDIELEYANSAYGPDDNNWAE